VRHQVFVSSTFLDLQEERDAVVHALLRMNAIPCGMELFPASDDDPLALIRRKIEECDYYVVIVAGRYGSVGADGVSFTELEYDYAVEIGLPVLAFIHANLSSLAAECLESDVEACRKLVALQEKIRLKTYATWTNRDNLALAVVTSMQAAIVSHPRPGYTRAQSLQTLRTHIAENTGRDLETLLMRFAEREVRNWTAVALEEFTDEGHPNRAVYSPDVSLSLEWGKPFRDDFQEDWTVAFPDPQARALIVDLLFNDKVISRELGVMVDGGRSILPLPERVGSPAAPSLHVSQWKASLFSLVNALRGVGWDYWEYFQRAGITTNTTRGTGEV
jgi:hypothetical protein